MASAKEDNERPWKCNVCQKTFKELNVLTTHRRSHTGERPFLCTFKNCSAAFARSDTLRDHLMAHTGAKRYSCPDPQCDRGFVKSHQMKTHYQRVHLSRKEFACDQCAATLASNVELRKHKEEVHGCIPFLCTHDGCEMRFASQAKLNRHNNQVHVGGYYEAIRKQNLRCLAENCSYVAPSKVQLSEHYSSCHQELFEDRTSPSATNCDTVPNAAGAAVVVSGSDTTGESCNTENSVGAISSGDQESPAVCKPVTTLHSCPIFGCGRTYSKMSNLASHMRASHAAIPRFQCLVEGCNQGFGYKSALENHMATMHHLPQPKHKKRKTESETRTHEDAQALLWNLISPN